MNFMITWTREDDWLIMNFSKFRKMDLNYLTTLLKERTILLPITKNKWKCGYNWSVIESVKLWNLKED